MGASKESGPAADGAAKTMSVAVYGYTVKMKAGLEQREYTFSPGRHMKIVGYVNYPMPGGIHERRGEYELQVPKRPGVDFDHYCFDAATALEYARAGGHNLTFLPAE